jgi:UDP-N-acetyl-D-mannosaminuronic acid dehydrogenase
VSHDSILRITGSFPDRRVCILGLGYVGLTLAAVMADAGFSVLGVEIRDEVLGLLSRGKAPFQEPGLEELLRRAAGRGDLRYAKHIPDHVDATVFIVTVGTPLDERGHARLDMVESVVRELASHLPDDALVIVRSTVKIGTTRTVVQPILEATGKRFHLASCPERTVEGQALAELRFLPQIVGANSFEATMRASQIFQFITPTVMRVSDVDTAETIKLVDNVHRDVTFAFANEISAACDALGISAMEVIASGRYGYPRTSLPPPGPVGGPCLSKDPHIFIESLASLGAKPLITMAARRTNEQQPEQVVAYLRELTARWADFPANPLICLLGIAFKGRPATDDLRGTMAGPILAALKRHFPGAYFRGFDAVVAPGEITGFGLEPAPTLEAAFEGADMALVLNNHPIFSDMPIAAMAGRMSRPALIYDFWNNFRSSDLHLPAGSAYVALGSHAHAVLPS